MRGNATIWYTGATYRLGRGRRCYGIWVAGAPLSQPVEQWPETPEGWSAAWSRFNVLEPPSAIVHLSEPAAPAVSAAHVAILFAVGVACGIAGLFPSYVSGASLASQPPELLPHVLYLAVWAASALLVASGGGRRRTGALLGLGTSVVTFGFFFADIGTVISGGARALGLGLVLGFAGWLACAAAATLALRLPAADAPRGLQATTAGAVLTLAVTMLAALGAAASFAPSWDHYTLRTATGVNQSLTAGNVFANPAPVIAGDVAVMAAFVAMAAVALLWRPARMGAALLAGALAPMVAQVVSALVQISEPVSPAAFGIAPAQAQRAGLTISIGVTPVFWVYVAFVAALVAACGWMVLPPRRPRSAGLAPGAPGAASDAEGMPGPAPWPPPSASRAGGISGPASGQPGQQGGSVA